LYATKLLRHHFSIFSIASLTPLSVKILRRYFLYDRKLLTELSRCAWRALNLFLTESVHQKAPMPGAAVAIQTFGDFLGFNPHCHILCTDGCFYGDGMFRVAPLYDLKKLEKIFQRQILKMLLQKGKITKDLAAMLSNWRHSGFNVFCGLRMQPGDAEAMENLARYIIRASFSQERMTYFSDESKVVYRSKDNKKGKTFDALEWLVAMCSHVPNKGEQMVRYYGYYSYYSNLCRSKREKQNKDDVVPCILEPEVPSKEYRKNWARLIQKIYEVDPLTCRKCSREMKVISVIEDEEVIKKIIKHLGLWGVKTRPPPKTAGPPKPLKHTFDYSTSQLPSSDKWLYVDVEYPDAYPS